MLFSPLHSCVTSLVGIFGLMSQKLKGCKHFRICSSQLLFTSRPCQGAMDWTTSRKRELENGDFKAN